MLAACFLSAQAAITSKDNVSVSVIEKERKKKKKEKSYHTIVESAVLPVTRCLDVAVWSVVSVTRQPCSPEGLT